MERGGGRRQGRSRDWSFSMARTNPKDPAVLKILRRCKFTKIYYGVVIYYGDPPCADSIFLSLAGIFPLKEGLTA